MDRAKIGKNNKAKGANAERYYRDEFISLGYTFCKTSRLTSRLLDNSKVDLNFIPFCVQVKAGAQKGIKPFEELKKMEEALLQNFPLTEKVHTYPKILIHKELAKAGEKRDKYMEKVYMTFEDFKLLINNLKNNE